MSDDDLERELQCLTPAAPPTELIARLNAAHSHSRNVVRFPRWLPFAAAACALFLLVRPGTPPPRTAPVGRVETFRPIEADRYLLSTDDLGVVELRPGEPYRLLRCVWADRETFRSEQGPAHLEVSQAREQIIPVALEAL